MIELSYEPLGELGIIGRRYFRKGGENGTQQIHITQYDNEYELERHLAALITLFPIKKIWLSTVS